MGDRGHIVLNYGDNRKIYLYTHWRGSQIDRILAEALDLGKSRWDDPGYLGRIIFQRLIGEDKSIIGFGLAPYPGDAGEFPEVMLNEKTVRLDPDTVISYLDYINT